MPGIFHVTTLKKRKPSFFFFSFAFANFRFRDLHQISEFNHVFPSPMTSPGKKLNSELQKTTYILFFQSNDVCML